MIKKTFFYFLLFFTFYLSHPVSAISTANVSVNPPSVSQKENEPFLLEVRLAVSEIVVGADLNISFDPDLVEVTKVTPGSFFINPQILTNNVDNQKGEVKFSLFSYPGKSGSDNFVNLEVKLLSSSFTSTNVTVEKNSVISGAAGKKIDTILGKTIISPLSFSSPTQSSPSPSISQAPSLKEPSPSPTIFTAEPTIFLVDQISPAPKTQSSSKLVGTLASFLIVLGTGILLVVILFLRKSIPNVKE